MKKKCLLIKSVLANNSGMSYIFIVKKRTSKFRFSKFYYPEPSDKDIPSNIIRTILT